MKEKVDKLIDLFIDKECLLKEIREPFRYKNFVCAANLYFVVMIYEKYAKHVRVSSVNKDKAFEVIDAPSNNNKPISRSLIVDELGRVPLIPETETVLKECEECVGLGEMEWEYQSKDGSSHCELYECPVCDGTGGAYFETPTGRSFPDPNGIINLDGVYFRHSVLLKLLETIDILGEEPIWTFRIEFGPNIFVFNKIVVIIMPCKK